MTETKLPKQWTLLPLEEIGNFSSGGTPSKSNETYWNGDIPWLSAKDLKSFYLRDSIDHVSELGAKNGTRMVPANTILILVRGMTLLKDVPIGITTRSMTFNQDVRAICVNEGFNPCFIAYSLVGRKAHLMSIVNVAGHGTGRLATELLECVSLRVPKSLLEQQKIAAILSTWDRAIELTEKLIAAKQKRKQALMQQLLTGPLMAIRKGASPKGWKAVKLGSLIQRRTETSSDLEAFPLHSLTIEDGVTPKTDRYERSFLLRDSENNEYSIVRFGDFVINPMNIRFGAIGRSKVEAAVTVSAYYDVFSVVSPDCDPGFLEHLLKSPLLMHTYEVIATGSLLEKKRVHFSEFVKIQLSLPSLRTQRRIASVLSSQAIEVGMYLQKIEKLKQQKKALMQRLLSGKVRVKVDPESQIE